MMKNIGIHLLFIAAISSIVACSKEEVHTPTEKECSLTQEQLTVLEEFNSLYAHGFETADPQVEEAALNTLIDYIGGASIVGLGEATHGSAEFFRMKDKIFRALVKQKDYKAIVFEIPWGNALVVNDYVTEDKGSSDASMDQTYYWVYDTQETRDLAEWMHTYNLDKEDENKIHFVGCDPQGPNFEIEREVVNNYLKAYSQSDFDTVFLRYSQLPIADLSNYSDLPIEQQTENAENVHWVYQYLADRRESLVSLSGNYEYELALMAAHVIKYREFMYRKQSFGQTRDSLMAVYTSWWQEILDEEAKVATWAHNFHVMDNQFSPSKWMGTFLRNQYGEDYINVGFSFSTGALNAFHANAAGNFSSGVREQVVPDDECLSLNYMFYHADPEQYYLIFDQMDLTSESFKYLNQPHDFFQMGAGFNRSYMRNYTQSLALPQLWDVMIHFDRVVASDLE